MTFPVVLAPAAAEALLKNLSSDKSNDKYVRFSVKGGGCQGLTFIMDIDNVTDSDDIVSEQDGIKMVVDALSAPYLENTTLEYIVGLMGSGFKFINSTKTTCGCGSSFSV